MRVAPEAKPAFLNGKASAYLIDGFSSTVSICMGLCSWEGGRWFSGGSGDDIVEDSIAFV